MSGDASAAATTATAAPTTEMTPTRAIAAAKSWRLVMPMARRVGYSSGVEVDLAGQHLADDEEEHHAGQDGEDAERERLRLDGPLDLRVGLGPVRDKRAAVG